MEEQIQKFLMRNGSLTIYVSNPFESTKCVYATFLKKEIGNTYFFVEGGYTYVLSVESVQIIVETMYGFGNNISFSFSI